MKILKDYPLKQLNTFRINVKAKLYAEAVSSEELVEVVSDFGLKKEKKFILGGGSNILFTKDFNGLVIKISIPGIKVIEENAEYAIVEAGAGVIWNDLVKFSLEKNLGGIENLVLIPGTVGAAPIQNIGAYGQELVETFLSLDGIFINSGESKTFTKGECNFSYRSSIFKLELRNEFVVTSLRLKLSKNPAPQISYKPVIEYLEQKKISNPTIKDVSNAVAQIRMSKLPDVNEVGNAGSFFKNPVINVKRYNEIKSRYPDIVSYNVDQDNVKVPAGWLIEKCGWKGKRAGSVGTYPKQALVIINYDNAAGAEVLEFAMRIKGEVESKFGIILEEEVNII